MEANRLLLEALGSIDPGALSYSEWLTVGMALHEEGCSCDDWEEWSSRDTQRYHPGECQEKWETFSGDASTPVTGATIVHLAKEHGWSTFLGHPLDWDDTISDISYTNSGSGDPVQDSSVQELIKYLQTLFDDDDYVGYVTQSYYTNGRYSPSKGCYDITAGELIERLTKAQDIGQALGSYDSNAGAWIRFNPLDGNGVKNENVIAFRHALVESDTMPVEVQQMMINRLHLPVACLVDSGGKSIHAVVRIDASTREEYNERVQFLYDLCEEEGMQLDRQNRNPSRLSRMPGVIRNGKRQRLIGINLGAKSWSAWMDWLSRRDQELPAIENLLLAQNNPPSPSPELIEGVLRQGHKMLLSGSSKAGKSYCLIELCIAIAEGIKWLQWQCAQGKVLYVNMELDRASCIKRFMEVYAHIGVTPSNMVNIDIWNLRGKVMPMDKLAPQLIEKATDADYMAVVIDPIYKCITGDENSASEMAHFTNQFDKVCHALGCSVIYSHHHSKGSQGSKRSMDRASGSGVFARDSDALLDLIQLSMDEATLEEAQIEMGLSEGETERLTAWRIEGTLREFPPFKPLNIFFNYPVHALDDSNLLLCAEPYTGGSSFSSSEKKKGRTLKRKKSLDKAYDMLSASGPVKTSDLASQLKVSDRTVLRYLEESGEYSNNRGIITRNN